jgi:hypothetical protein
MAQLPLHIAFDNSSRLRQRTTLFRYKGVTFKLIQNDHHRWSDVLLTLVPLHNDGAMNVAYGTGAEFLSALNWKVEGHIALHNAGGPGKPDDFRLNRAACQSFSFPEIPFYGNSIGYPSHPFLASQRPSNAGPWRCIARLEVPTRCSSPFCSTGRSWRLVGAGPSTTRTERSAEGWLDSFCPRDGDIWTYGVVGLASIWTRTAGMR